MKKSTEVVKSPLNGVKMMLAIGLFLGLCFLFILMHSTYSDREQSALLAAYALLWSAGCIGRVRYLHHKKVHKDGEV